MRYILLLKFSCFFLLCNCSSHKEAKQIIVLKHQTIDLGNEQIGFGGFLSYNNGVIIGIEMHPSMPPFFCFIPDESSQKFFYFGSKGRGPNEFIMPYSIQYIDEQTTGVFDVMSITYSEFNNPIQNETLTVNKKIQVRSSSSRIFKTAFNQYIALSLNDEMFVLMDSTGVVVNTFFEYPYQNSAERKLASRFFAYQGTLATNPSKTKFAYSSFRGEIIHFYTIEKNNIESIRKIENEYPLYKEATDGNRGVIYDTQGRNGYIATYATEEYVYAIFSGETVLEQTKKRSINFEGHFLHIFDWNGFLIREYELDLPCSYLCVSDDNNKIWAIASIQDEITLVLFDLKNVIEKRQGIAIQKVNNSSEVQSPIPIKFSIEVRTKNGEQNSETKRILDSIKRIPAHIALDISFNNRYNVQVDTIDNYTRKIVITLK